MQGVFDDDDDDEDEEKGEREDVPSSLVPMGGGVFEYLGSGLPSASNTTYDQIAALDLTVRGSMEFDQEERGGSIASPSLVQAPFPHLFLPMESTSTAPPPAMPPPPFLPAPGGLEAEDWTPQPASGDDVMDLISDDELELRVQQRDSLEHLFFKDDPEDNPEPQAQEHGWLHQEVLGQDLISDDELGLQDQ